ncbi:hypothetical protein LIER_20055 [Lithospermum erythrorhizon]|uniref:J domain-containing protein n=1 Tax=Lithospermum erythrorhizon TaxID=34254 RepID=A0AAV3QNP8_LITER
MECNRDEALRAKEIAEKKLAEKDIKGAKKFAVKAQNLNPGLDGISQMMAALDVYIAAEKKVNGEGNWYGILGLDRLADEDTVRKQYHKLALLLHPDKNNTVGAEGAFHIISEAWSLLSDRSKKLAYDQRITPVQNGSKNAGPSSAHMQSGFYDFSKRTAPHMKVPKAKSDKVGSSSNPSSSHKQERTTFWTVCHQCKMQYEYLKMYRNKNLLCPNCHVAFFAAKIPSPSSDFSKRSTKSHQTQQQKNLHRDEAKRKAPSTNKGNPSMPNGRSSGVSSSYSTDGNNFQWVPFSSNTSAMSATQAATMVQQAYEKVKREREEAQAAIKREQVLRQAHKRANGASTSASFDTVKRRRVSDDCSRNGLNKKRSEGIAVANTFSLSGHANGDYGPARACKLAKSNDACHFSIKQLLVDMARKDLKKRLIEQHSTKFETMVERGKEKCNGENIDNGMALNKSKYTDKLDTGNRDSLSLVTANYLTYRCHKHILQQFSIVVPDSDFHDFGKNRLEECFRENQVWAAFDGNDGMPRCYAMIHKVVSLLPFKIQISWLDSKANVNFVFSGFLRTTGDFRLGRRDVIESIDCFSHELKWTKNACGSIQIFPKKGDVWALYRDWCAEWDEFTEDEVIRKYDLVEVLEDYNGQGVTVIPLIKVAGFTALFHRHLDLSEIRNIPGEEIFRFSHHVPSHLLTGKKRPRVPIGCRELDPAATPSELLEVMIDTKEELGPEELMEVDDVEDNNDTSRKS